MDCLENVASIKLRHVLSVVTKKVHINLICKLWDGTCILHSELDRCTRQEYIPNCTHHTLCGYSLSPSQVAKKGESMEFVYINQDG